MAKQGNTFLWMALAGGGVYLYYYYRTNGRFPWQPAPAPVSPSYTPLSPYPPGTVITYNYPPATTMPSLIKPVATPATTTTTATVQTPATLVPSIAVNTPGLPAGAPPVVNNPASSGLFHSGAKGIAVPGLTPGAPTCTPYPKIPNGAVILTEAEWQSMAPGGKNLLYNSFHLGIPVYVIGRGQVFPDGRPVPPVIPNVCPIPYPPTRVIGCINSSPGHLGVIAKPR